MAVERITERPAGDTVIVERSGGGGGGMGMALVAIVVVAVLALVAYFVIQQNQQGATRTAAVSAAADSVGAAADNVGKAAQKAGDAVTPN